MIVIELFPFSLVEKNSKIIIYGYGNVGLNYYLQIIKSNYCEVLAFVDRKSNEISHSIMKVISPEELFAISGEEYDYIVIANGNNNTAITIKEYLLSNDILPEKIVMPYSPSIIGDFCYLDYYRNKLLNCNLRDFKEIVFEFKDTFERIKINVECVYTVALEVLKERYFNQNLHIDEFVEELDINKLQESSALINGIEHIYLSGKFDKFYLELWMNILLKTKWEKGDDTPYYATLYSDHPMRFAYKDSTYDNFYKDREILMNRICSFYELSLPEIKKGKRLNEQSEKRVVVTLYTLQFLGEAWEKIPARYINGFAKNGYKVKVVVLDSTIDSDPQKIYINKLYEHFIPEDSQKRINEWFEEGVSVEYVDEYDIGARMQKAIDVICDFDPLFILDCSDEYFPEGYLLNKKYPIIYFPLKGFSSSASFNIYITNDKISVLKEGVIPSSKIKALELGNLVDEETDVKYSREELGFGKNDFIIVTVGKRLRTEIDKELILPLCNVLEKDSSIKWVIIGSVPDDSILVGDSYKALLQNGQIVHISYEKKLFAFLECCDVLLQPNRQGGGATVKMAMQKGLPVAMTDYPSDNLKRMQGHVIKGGYKELVEYILHLKNDPEFKTREGLDMKKLISVYSNEKDIKQVLEACEETADIYWKR